MPSPRYTVRLPDPLHQAVQARLAATGVSFTTLIRNALSVYLADSPAAPADSADTLRLVQEHLADLSARVEKLEQAPPSRPQGADRRPDSLPTPSRHLSAGADAVLTRTDTAPAYDPARYILGRLCPRGHEWGATGQTLRKRHSGTCVTCEREQQRERRARKRQGA
jgi:hypothetical protein